jgi:hypothetical protein
MSSKPTGAVVVNNARIYKSLDREIPEIRVLKLLPSSDLEAPIEGWLVQWPLHSDSHEYEALSYVWGVPELIRKITLNGESFLVTRNLEMALRYLRLADAERTIWVDALCINQSDSDERSWQVMLMRDIYAGCQADLAWMLNYEEALELSPSHSIEQRSQISRGEKQDAKVYADMQLIGHAMEMTRQSASNMKDIEQHDASDLQGSEPSAGGPEISRLSLTQVAMLAPFFNSTYLWYRVWTMQELSFAPQLIMVAGTHQLDWAVVSDFLGERPFADAYHAMFRHFLRSMDWNRTLGGAQKVDTQRRIIKDNQYTATLLDVLARFQSNEATDPRDCVYGLLGLVTEKHSVLVDYTKSTIQVFMDTTIAIIKSSGNLDIICQTAWMAWAPSDGSAQPKSVPDLPTWIPDFSRQVDYGDHEKILFAQRGIYKPGRDKYAGRFDDSAVNNRLLPVKAVVLGVLDLDVMYPKNRPLYQREQDTPRQWLEALGIGAAILEKEEKYEPTGETRLGAYWRTLLVDCTCYPIKRLTSEDKLIGDRVFREILGIGWEHSATSSSKNGNVYEEVEGFDDTSNSHLKDEDETLNTIWKDGLPKPMRDMWLRNYKSWTFAVTNNGLYTMVKSARRGDVIASVEGAKVPLILRAGESKHDGRRSYSLVGTAYVHGYMDGEALRDVARGKMSEEAILLL